MNSSNKKATYKKWNDFVEEYAAEPWVDEINGREITALAPTGKKIKQLRALGEEDLEETIKVLFGEEDGQFLLDAWDEAPAMVLNGYLEQLLKFFGLSDGAGNR